MNNIDNAKNNNNDDYNNNKAIIIMIVIIKIIVIIITTIIIKIIIMITISQNNLTGNCINKTRNLLSCQLIINKILHAIKAIWKKRFKTMLLINFSFPKFSISSALVNYCKL